MIDRRKAFSLISSRDHCQKFSASWISDTVRAGFEHAQNLSSGLVEWSCAVKLQNKVALLMRKRSGWGTRNCYQRIFWIVVDHIAYIWKILIKRWLWWNWDYTFLLQIFLNISQYVLVIFALRFFIHPHVSKRWLEVSCVIKSKVIYKQPQLKYKTWIFQNNKEKNSQKHSLTPKANWNFKVLLGLNISTIKQLNFLFVFFSISTTTLTWCNKDLNLFDEYAAECVHLCPQKE